jgi:hypothetical protein
MRQRRQTTISDLRLAIECLPRETRIAMLDGIRRNPIIVGAYSDSDGICPMLAAHRAGGRTSVISFAKTWDGFAFRGQRVRRARRATERELLILRTQLEASLLGEDAPAGDLAAAVAEHRALAARRTESAPEPAAGVPPGDRVRPGDCVRPGDRVRPGDPDRSRELRQRPGWGWMRVVRRLDDFERTLEALGAQDAAGAPAAEREPARI